MNLNRIVVFFLLASCVFSCTKSNENFNPQGGFLPTNYINIYDSSFSPSAITLASGSSVTFLNRTSSGHSILSDDSSVIISPLIAPGAFFYIKPDSVSGTTAVNIQYHCKEHPSARGTITLRR